eukprot:2978784-Prymnesium_polylepis.1
MQADPPDQPLSWQPAQRPPAQSQQRRARYRSYWRWRPKPHTIGRNPPGYFCARDAQPGHILECRVQPVCSVGVEERSLSFGSAVGYIAL